MNDSIKKNFLDRIDRRYRLYISLAVALLVALVANHRTSGAVVFMLAWVTFAGTSLLFSWATIFTSHPRKVKAIAKEQDTSRTLIFLFVVTAAFISLFAIIVLLQNIPDTSKRGLTSHILLAAASVFCSWTLIHTLFTLRYAHLYYIPEKTGQEAKRVRRGLEFPGNTEPDYLDFAYFSFVLGMTFQVSDVQITSRRMRRLALLHGLLSFVYNTVIVALSINIISGIIEK